MNYDENRFEREGNKYVALSGALCSGCQPEEEKTRSCNTTMAPSGTQLAEPIAADREPVRLCRVPQNAG